MSNPIYESNPKSRLALALFLVFLVAALWTTTVQAQSGEWLTHRTRMPTARWDVSCNAVNGRIYAIGGAINFTRTGTTGVVEEYDIATDVWTRKQATYAGHVARSSSVVNGKIYLIGGNGPYGGNYKAVYAYDPVRDTMTAKRPMPTGRGRHAAGVLNGLIYVFGGGTTTMVIYNPATDSWKSSPALSPDRPWISAAAVGGKIYAIGGANSLNGPQATVDEFDPATGVWKRRSPMPVARREAACAVIGGKIWVFGGNASTTPGTMHISASISVYDPAQNVWTTPTITMPAAQYSMGGVSYGKGAILIGGAKSNAVLNLVQEFNVGSQGWETKASMPLVQPRCTVDKVGGKFYFVGGGLSGTPATQSDDTVQEYDPATNRWRSRKPLPFKTMLHASGAVMNQKIYVIGGKRLDLATRTSIEYVNHIQVYNPATNTWQDHGSYPNPRFGMASVAVGWDVYVFGGYRLRARPGGGYFWDIQNWVHKYDTLTKSWQTLAPMPEKRSRAQAHFLGSSPIGGKIYVIGGVGRNINHKVLIYDRINNRWSQGATKPVTNFFGSSIMPNGKIYSMGGNGTFKDRIEIYHPVLDAWSTCEVPLGPMLNGRMMPACFAYQAPNKPLRIFAAGGSYGNATVLDAFTPADPKPGIKANGKKGVVLTKTNKQLEVTLTLDPTIYSGLLGDWWVVANVNQSSPFFSFGPAGWQPGFSSFQMPLSQIAQPLTILKTKPYMLPPGIYDFWFGFDLTPDGAVNAPWHDRVSVVILP